MQRQLQLRIEAQGKYLKKIIEEQQRRNGVLGDAPDTDDVNSLSADKFPDLEKKAEPVNPAVTSESLLQEEANMEHAPAKSLSIDESFSSHPEPSTPDSGSHMGFLGEKPGGERLMKKQRVSKDAIFDKQEVILPHQIFESSLTPSYPQTPVFLSRDHFDPSMEISIGCENQIRRVSGDDL